MKFFNYTKPKMIVADEGYGLRDKNDVYVPEHYDMDGNLIRYRVREDLAIAFQHELDHLNGFLFTDYIDPKDPYKDSEVMREI